MSAARPAGPSAWTAARAILLGDGINPEFFTRTAERFPRLAHVRLGREDLYLLSHPDLVRLLLVDSGRITGKSRGLQGARRILGTGLLTSEEPYHQHARRLVQPAFHADLLAGYAGVMSTAAAEVAAGWRDGDRVDMAAQMSGLTFEVVSRALFGARMQGRAATVRAALEDLLAAYNRAFLPWFDLSLRLGTPMGRRVKSAAAQLDSVVHDLIAQHRAAPGTDLLSILLADFDDAQLRDEAMTLMLAGHETTAAALSSAWYFLDRHPDAREWLDAELDGGGGLSLAALPRTRAVLAETMRLHPPAWVLGRRFTEPAVIDGWEIPRGASALVSAWVLHRDGRFWSRPREFRPQRWIGANGEFSETAPGQPRYAYFPFGAGRRMCLGESFAWTEATLVLAALARGWRAPVIPGYPLRLRAAITLRPAGPLPMQLQRR